MSQQPHEPRAHGGPPPPGAPPYAKDRSPRPPVTADLRLLLRLTVASFVMALLGSAVGFLTAPEQATATALGPAFDTIVLVGSVLLGLGVTAGLYALVYFPLREQRQWAWILGIVLASMALLGTLANAALLLVVPAGVSAGLLTGALKAVVDVAWLVVAVRPGVRAALR
ncbi:hypothetical protein [Kocuria rosea]|uniref:hypothetical protein n=1 Tax=Kocuria rosea TaxID=1275 RepID=UPI000B065D55|nr:hypothetical protein [Kocuria polaris]